jgi:hypothetical protein
MAGGPFRSARVSRRARRKYTVATIAINTTVAAPAHFAYRVASLFLIRFVDFRAGRSKAHRYSILSAGLFADSWPAQGLHNRV